MKALIIADNIYYGLLPADETISIQINKIMGVTGYTYTYLRDNENKADSIMALASEILKQND